MSLEKFLKTYKPYEEDLFPLDREIAPHNITTEGFFSNLPSMEIEEFLFSSRSFELFLRLKVSEGLIPESILKLYELEKKKAIMEIENNPNAFDGRILGLDQYSPVVLGGKGLKLAVREVRWSDLLATNRSETYKNLAFGYLPSYKGNINAFLGNPIGTNVLLIVEYKGGIYATVVGKRSDKVDYEGGLTLMGGYLDNDYLEEERVKSMIAEGKQPQHLTALREFLEEFPEEHPLSKEVNTSGVVKIYLTGYNRQDYHPEGNSIIYLKRSSVSLEDDMETLERIGTSTDEAENLRIIPLGEIAREIPDESYFKSIVPPQRPMFALAAYMSENTPEKLACLGFNL